MRTMLGAGLVVCVGVGLACGGVGPAPSPSPKEWTFAVPEGLWLVQTPDGLWTERGEWVAEFSGEMSLVPGPAPSGPYWISPTQTSFFLFSTHGLVVGERRGGMLTVRMVREDATLRRPIGEVGLTVMGERTDRKSHLVNLAGEVLMEDVRSAPSNGQEPPVEHAEYWWSESYLARPAAVCQGRSVDRCGYITRSGDWLFTPGPNPSPPMYVEPIHIPPGEGVLFADGRKPFPRDALKTWMGPGSEDRVLIGEAVEGAKRTQPIRERVRTTIADLNGNTLASVDAPVVWETARCPGGIDRRICAYVFHEGLAVVSVAGSDDAPPYRSVYIDTEGTIAIDAAPCEGMATSGPFHEGRAFQCSGSEYWLIDRDGTRLAGPYPDWKPDREDRDAYLYGLFFSEGLAAVPTEGGWMYVDREGAVVLPGPYQLARPFRHGVAMVKEAGVVKVVDREGKGRFQGFNASAQ